MTPPSTDASALVHALVHAWNAHDADAIVARHADDYEGSDVGLPGLVTGQAALRHAVDDYLRAFPDVSIQADHLFTRGDEAALFWTARGTHQGPLLHIPPTGRVVEIRGAWLLRFEGGKVHRSTVLWDVAGLLRALGLLPLLHT